MDKEKFRQHFASATKLLIDLTQSHCFNDLAFSFKFIITPNSRNPDNHLNEQEIEILNAVNKIQKKLLTDAEVIDLLHREGKVPLWINMTIYESQPKVTIIALFCSRRFRNDSELNYKVDKYPPFHPLVPLPPDSLKIEKNGKFDINWKKRLDNSKNFLAKLRRFFKAN